ncbi:hypothetical protein NP233_g9418 [Leucocoprinus birnbaumii]|uniref:Nephrocystin 3-like N-terminal domain-containing protein n=1 Tax=Leucocoprinus birnbaumii TaxID=56174 RepID=A0AAD5VQY3_9AGAR|nr:hypothetical protein NP233_g9418 [Leucocoprinus birnbaumii]
MAVDPSIPRSPVLPPTGQTLQVIPPDLTAQGSSHVSRSEFFANAQNFSIGSAVFVDNRQIDAANTTSAIDRRDRDEVHMGRRVPNNNEERETEEYEKRIRLEEREWERRGEEALQRLERGARPDAMLDRIESAGYVPRCNEDTRESLRDRLTYWGSKIETVEQCLLWLFGPAGVGKSAVAQSVAETLRDEESFGAGFFFSRPNKRSNPDDVIPTLVYQLALLLAPYRLVLGQVFKANPKILNTNRRNQFQELITTAFLPDLTCRPFTLLTHLSDQLLQFLSHRSLLIILDGLDECSNLDAQHEFVELIGGYARLDYHRRLRWMICSRPDPQISAAFDAFENQAIFSQEEIEIDDPEAQQDASRMLERGFNGIRKRFPHQLDPRWPDPSHLDVCLNFLEDSRRGGDHNPLHLLDLLYTRIFSDISKGTLSNTRLVLGVLILHGNAQLTAHVLANFLGLDRATFYSSLYFLHSVLSIPVPDRAHTTGIRVYHASFSDFLKDKRRSGEYSFDEEAINLCVAIRGLKWLGHFGHYTPGNGHVLLPEPLWISDLATRKTVIDKLSKFAFAPTWRAFPRVSEKDLSILEEEIQNFDFSLIGREHLRWYSEDDMEAFGYFIRWLLSSKISSLARLVRRRSGRAGKKNEITIVWNEKDAPAFVRPLTQNVGLLIQNIRLMGRADRISSLHVEIRGHSRVVFHLVFSMSPQDAEEYSENDIVIMLLGSPSSGKSHFVDLLTRGVGLAASDGQDSEISEIRATRVLHPKYGNRIVLVNTPGLVPSSQESTHTMALIDKWFIEK